MSRRLQTTEQLRQAAFAEWIAAGPRAMSHRGVARRACYSEAAVFQRWPDRQSLLDDVVRVSVIPRVEALVGALPTDCTIDEWLQAMVGSEEAGRSTQGLAELLFAARDEAHVLPLAAQAVGHLFDSVPVADLAEPLQRGCRWWLVGHVFGEALLRRCGCPLEQHHHALARVLTGGRGSGHVAPPAPNASGPLIAALPRYEPADQVERAILEVSRSHVLRAGAAELHVRDVAADAGVTTGALYRRWKSRSDLLMTLIESEALGDRYRWLPQLLAGAEGGLGGAAATARRVWAEPSSRDMLLGLAVEAHTDEQVRARLAAQVMAVVDARLDELHAAAAHGQLTGWMTPQELTWLLQTPPVGLRLLSAIGVEPSDDEYRAVLAAFAAAAIGLDDAQFAGDTL